jgi:DNA topoisomerase-1
VRLRYVTTDAPGIRRVRSGAGFRYRTPRGRAVTSARTLARIRALAIPPAWTDVWICTTPHGHLQATGRDARRRKQYRYHAAWRARREETKYERVVDFARALPRIRSRVRRDLRLSDLPREKVLAAIVGLLGTTFARIGNDEYVRANASYGIATLRDHHAKVRGAKVRLRFRGKGGKVHETTVEDPRLARIVRSCRDLPGQRLFQYVDAKGASRTVGSADVNAYIRDIAGEEFTAKDFRTWGGTLSAAASLLGDGRNRRKGRRASKAAIAAAAAVLGNTPAICRKSYIHPSLLAVFDDDRARVRWKRARVRPARVRGLLVEERVVVRFLELCAKTG